MNYYLSKLLMSVAAVAVTSTAAMAVPALPGFTEVMQPDGSFISVRMEGDEFGHLAFDRSGRLLERDSRGFYVESKADVRELSKAISGRRERKNARRCEKSLAKRKIGLFSHTNFPSHGAHRTLVILVEFQDRPFLVEDPADFYDRMLNDDNFTEFGATGSAGKYFADNSRGQFTPHFDVVGPVKVPGTVKYYGANIPVWTDGFTTLYDDAKPYQMVFDACGILHEQGFDFSQYDANGDGEVDNIYVYYAGYGEADGGPADTIWPHAYYLDEVEDIDPVYYDGVLLSHYACSNELKYPTKPTDSIVPDGIGTIVHEFSHVMGFPDLYATLGTECNTPRFWSVMDVGCYLNNSRTPPGYSAFELMAFGWYSPEDLTEGYVTFDELHGETGKAYIVRRKEVNSDGVVPEEFFIFENRQKEGWDSYIPGHGMLVWHIDFDQDDWDYNTVNAFPERQRVMLVEADNQPAAWEVVEEPGKKPEYKQVYYNEGDPFPGTTGNVSFTSTSVPAFVDWSGNAMPFDITDIAEDANGRISFRAVSTDANGVELTLEEKNTMVRYYNLQGLEVRHPRKGEILLKVEAGRSRKVVY